MYFWINGLQSVAVKRRETIGMPTKQNVSVKLIFIMRDLTSSMKMCNLLGYSIMQL